MYEDSMDVESGPAYGAVAQHDASGHGGPETANMFFPNHPQSGFLAPSHDAVHNQLSSGGFGSPIPPGVEASNSSHDDMQTLGTNDRLPAKMHLRRPGRDNWSYIGRVNVHQELTHKSPIVVVRLQNSDKIVVTFSEQSNISVDKRGNFIVVAAVEPAGVISYSLHAQTNNDALRILASIELAAYKLGTLTGMENRQQAKLRRKIEKTIKDDRRRRHKRKKDDDALVAMLDGANLGATVQ